MLTGALNKMREERARFARDIEELRQMYMEDAIDDRETEIEFIDKIPEDDDFTDKEINTILNSDHDLSFDELVCGKDGCDGGSCGEECDKECGGSCGTECGDKCSGGCGNGKTRLLG